MTPRKLAALLKVHYEIQKARNGASSEAPSDGFIDDIAGWN